MPCHGSNPRIQRRQQCEGVTTKPFTDASVFF